MRARCVLRRNAQGARSGPARMGYVPRQSWRGSRFGLIEGSVARQGRRMMGAKAEKKNLEPMTMQLFVYEASQG